MKNGFFTKLKRDIRRFLDPLYPNPVYEGEKRRSQHRLMRRLLGLAMTIGVMLAAAQILLPPPFGKNFETDAGEIKVAELKDGSVVKANSDTKLSVSFSTVYRRIYLKHGEALFEVAHDIERPFDVLTGLGDIRAVGTIFSVVYSPGVKTAIDVKEGRVKVTARESSCEYLVAASYHLTLESGKPETRVCWQGNVLRIEEATVGTIVAYINRRGERRIIIDDSSIASIVVPVMTLNPYRFQNFLEGIQSPNIIQDTTADGVVHLKSQSGDCAPQLRCSDKP